MTGRVEGFDDAPCWPKVAVARRAQDLLQKRERDVRGDRGVLVGDIYVGTFAMALALWSPPLFGGIAIVAVIAVVTRAQRSFRH